MKNKKIVIAILIVILIAIAIVTSILVSSKQKEEKAKQALYDFMGLINEKNYESMYEKVSIMNMSKEDFVKRNKNIYEGIDSQDIKIEIQEIKKQDGEYQIKYHQKMFTAAGEVEFDNTVAIQEDNQIKWSSRFIFPQLGDNQKVRISTIQAKRGDILDRNNKKLATDGVIEGKQEKGRIYSLGKEAGHLIGYVQYISEEELLQKEGKGYHTHSKIGKVGLEKVYEETLRGMDGAEISITDENGNKIEQILKQDKKDGKDVKLTIDSDLQTKIYQQMQNDKGFFVVMHPKTGELLALVSTPTFDSNDFVAGISQAQWETLTKDENKPLYNRFLQKYCPGSTFKPVTGAIGLTTEKINADEDYGYIGTNWQKDNTWGNYQITTLTGYQGSKNLLNGMIHSDNIYFAQSALKIGADTFAKELDKLGFNETLDFPLTLEKSQYANQNGKKIEGETKLADTGYGQGSVLVNPIHMASIYSAFANEGNMVKPYLIYDTQKVGTWQKQNVFSEEAANKIKQALIQVVENKEGTANDMKISGITIAGKTGTAELKTSNEDTQSGTLGWFDCFTEDLLIISMVENKQKNQDGGSHYLIQKIRTLLE